MFDLQGGGFRLMHWHGGDTWVPMAEVEHDVASHDPERQWIKGARIYRCTTCEEQVAIAPEDPGDLADPDHPHPGV
jgi:hypothetical protein